MNDSRGYVVFFFPQALEALGEPIKPYLLGTAGNEYVLCREVDTAGALIEMTLDGQAHDGKVVQVELMVPSQMVRMIVSAHGDEDFGFHPRVAVKDAPVAATAPPAAVAPAVAPADAAGTTPAAAPAPTPAQP
ncbi:hypothetical protein [Lysobacter fragariae]